MIENFINQFYPTKAPFFTRKESVESCCASNPCTDSNAVCTDVAITGNWSNNIFKVTFNVADFAKRI